MIGSIIKTIQAGRNKEIMSIFYPEAIIKLAKTNAIEMIKNNEDFRKIKFGHDSGYFFLSDNPERVVGGFDIDVEGKKFFISLFST